MVKKNEEIEPLGKVLEKSLKRLELSPQLDQYGVWPIWNDIVGAPIARNAQPEKIRNGTLFVKVSSPVWMQQLQYMKEMIAEKLNERLRADIVKNIFFVVGRVEGAAELRDPQQPALPTPTRNEPHLDDAFLNHLTDPEVRQAFKRLLRSYARRKSKT
jgi:predicted nucleic acid-binding Zn ribbon protein